MMIDMRRLSSETRWAAGLLFFSLLLAPVSGAFATGSLLRIACEGADAGAEVTINGVFKGECPLDVQVPAGTIELRALKRVDVERERVFAQSFRIGDGVVKKVEAVLSLQLSAEGQRQQREAEEARRKAAAEQQRRLDETLERYRAAAEAGDTTAMVALGALYDEGVGVPKSSEQAIAWYRKATDAGDKRGDFRLSERYRRSSQDPDVVAVDRMFALPAEKRDGVVVEGKDAIKAFIARDRFFIGAGDGRTANHTYTEPLAGSLKTTSLACRREGSTFLMTLKTGYRDASSTAEGEALLGGIAWLQIKSSSGFLRSTTTEIQKIEDLEGQPFPLRPDSRFGFKATYRSSGEYGGDGKPWSVKLTCAVTNVRVAAVGSVRIPEAAPQVICYSERDVGQEINRYFFDQQSGCLLDAGKK